MYNQLLQQVPLTVSPFVSLPTATTLPYTYKSLPSTLPQSSTGPDPQQGQEKAKYITSASGQEATPEGIISSCAKLQDHLRKSQDDATAQVKLWEKQIQERELAEKRRLAPGWLDSDARILEPEKRQSKDRLEQPAMSLLDAQEDKTAVAGFDDDAAGRELDLAFGGMSVKKD